MGAIPGPQKVYALDPRPPVQPGGCKFFARSPGKPGVNVQVRNNAHGFIIETAVSFGNAAGALFWPRRPATGRRFFYAFLRFFSQIYCFFISMGYIINEPCLYFVIYASVKERGNARLVK
jgi:hypothetical protein